jgi:hypothetical protein
MHITRHFMRGIKKETVPEDMKPGLPSAHAVHMVRYSSPLGILEGTKEMEGPAFLADQSIK